MASGGKRPGAGRKRGAVAPAKMALSDMAKKHAAEALMALAAIAKGGESEAARVSASTAILDRAYGKPFTATDDEGGDEAPALNINITTREAVGDVRVTKSGT